MFHKQNSNRNDVLQKNLLPYGGEVYYFPQFFSSEVADQFYKKLLTEIKWKEEAIRIFGKSMLQPRQTAWCGEKDYAYSSLVMPKGPWVSILPEIKSAVEKAADADFNGVLLNHYRNGQDSMGWHRDNERELGAEPIIAPVSLGESRKFVLRYRKDPKVKVEIILENGSLLLMRGQSQQAWEHSLPKSKKAIRSRINLTFRYLF